MSILADAAAMLDRVAPHTGPVSYVTYVAPTTGGDSFLASEAGLKNLYHCSDGITQDGLYEVVPIQSAVGPLGGGQASVILAWFVLSTGLQVGNGTNLSASIVPLRVLGN